MICPICNNEYLTDCPCCGYHTTKEESVIKFFKDTISLSSSFSNLVGIPSTEMDSFSQIDILKQAIKEGELFSDHLHLLLEKGKVLWQLMKEDEDAIKNIYHSLASLSEIENKFNQEYCLVLEDKINQLKKY